MSLCKKIITSALFLTCLMDVASAADDINLPKPQISDKLSVAQALSQRHSSRNFVDKSLTNSQLSNLLWAANGINREADKKRVNPTAMGVYCVDVYAVTKDGIYLYQPDSHSLKLIAKGDHRKATTLGQEFVSKAALNIVYVMNPAAWEGSKRVPDAEKMRDFANVTAGAMVQSVALIAEVEGLGNCVRASVDKDAFAKAAKLSSENVLLGQTVGILSN